MPGTAMHASDPQGPVILCMNAGSSSVKAALFRVTPEAVPVRLATLSATGIGEAKGSVICAATDDPERKEERITLDDHARAVSALFDALRAHRLPQPTAVGHRIVRSPPGQSAPAILDAALRGELDRMRALAPLHLPPELDAIDAAEKRFPEALQTVCFDNHFFSRLPETARRLPLPERFEDAGIRRIGYHGLSYEYITQRLPGDSGRTVIAHLGNGASMAAVHNGRPLDTTMGYTPTGGLMMGTRTGDLDPGVLVAVLRREALDPDALERLVDKEAGLYGVSGGEASMKILLERARNDNAAGRAVGLFCYTARKHLGAMIAVLGGIDTLVFTGGVGENAAPVRAAVIEGLGDLGLAIDPEANNSNAADVTAGESRVRIRVIATDEEQVIAAHTSRLLKHEEAES